MPPRPAAQHAWEDTFRADEAGRALPPRHHRLLMLDVVGSPCRATPTTWRPRSAPWRSGTGTGPTAS